MCSPSIGKHSKYQFISQDGAFFGQTFILFASSVSSGFTDQSLRGTLFCRCGRWSWNVESRSDITLFFLHYLPISINWCRFFPAFVTPLLEQYGANRFDHLLAAPSYQSRCLCAFQVLLDVKQNNKAWNTFNLVWKVSWLLSHILLLNLGITTAFLMICFSISMLCDRLWAKVKPRYMTFFVTSSTMSSITLTLFYE